MSIKSKRIMFIAGLLGSASLPGAGHAQTALPAPTGAPSATAPSDSAMVNLVRLLVAQKVLSADKGAALMAQAQAEANAARQAAATQLAAAAPVQPTAADLPPPASGTVRVAYIPELVRDQLKQELRNEVMAQAKEEGWAAKGAAAPDWTRRIALSGDIRFRSESAFYSGSNSNRIFNFAAMNQSGPFNVAGIIFPFLNTTEDKPNQFRVRARLGIAAKVADGVDAGFQLATGDDNSPISTNSTLTGGLAKRNIWLQQAWLRLKPREWGSLTVGRMPNPFMSTDLVFDDDLAFDGVAAEISARQLFGYGIDVKLRGGAFPLDFGDANYLSSQTAKLHYPQKYLFSVQGELDARLNGNLAARFGAAYHHFSNVQGQLSDPCFTGDGQVDCSTDGSRPFFLRKGNTLSYVRQLASSNGAPLTSLPQYFGLTFNYHLLNLNSVLSYDLDNGRKVELSGDYVLNVGLRHSDICRNGVFGEPFNNGGSEGGSASICDTTGPHTRWVGSRYGWQAMLRVGDPQPMKWGQWQVEAGYRRIGTDAVLDSLSDSDFHLGGTNAKGYIVGVKAGIFNNVALGARWLSADQISGDPLAIDVLQVDLNARF